MSKDPGYQVVEVTVPAGLTLGALKDLNDKIATEVTDGWRLHSIAPFQDNPRASKSEVTFVITLERD